jgi:hypothetical protein
MSPMAMTASQPDSPVDVGLGAGQPHRTPQLRGLPYAQLQQRGHVQGDPRVGLHLGLQLEQPDTGGRRRGGAGRGGAGQDERGGEGRGGGGWSEARRGEAGGGVFTSIVEGATSGGQPPREGRRHRSRRRAVLVQHMSTPPRRDPLPGSPVPAATIHRHFGDHHSTALRRPRLPGSDLRTSLPAPAPVLRGPDPPS